VGAAVGLGVPVPPLAFAGHERRLVLELLPLGAVLEQRRAEHPDAEGVERAAAAEAAHLGGEHARFRGRQAATAILAWPGGRGPAALGHALEPEALRFGLEGPVAPAPAAFGVVGDRFAHLGRAVGLEPGAGLAPEVCERVHFCLSPGCIRMFDLYENTRSHRGNHGDWIPGPSRHRHRSRWWPGPRACART